MKKISTRHNFCLAFMIMALMAFAFVVGSCNLLSDQNSIDKHGAVGLNAHAYADYDDLYPYADDDLDPEERVFLGSGYISSCHASLRPYEPQRPSAYL